MHAHRRARHAGADAQALRGVRDAADHAPHERALPLPVDPGMVVVGDQPEAEPRVLGHRRVADQVVGTMLLARDLVADLHHGGPPPTDRCKAAATDVRRRGRGAATRRARRRGRRARTARRHGTPPARPSARRCCPR